MARVATLCALAGLGIVLHVVRPASGLSGDSLRTPRGPLEEAAQAGDVERVKNLLALEQNPYVRDYALQFAIRGRHREVTELLIAHGARYALKVASEEGDVDLVKQLLAKGADAKERDSALFFAAARGRKEVVELLLSQGAKVDTTRFGDYTPLFVAAAAGCDLDALQRFTNFPLFPWGADQKQRQRSPANAKTFRDTVALLIQHGADVNAREKQHGFTPLHYAVFGGSREVVEALLDGGAPADPAVPSGNTASRYISPLHLAAHYGDLSVCELLVVRGAEVNSKLPTEGKLWMNPTRRTPLHHATESRTGKLVEFLLNHGADACAVDNEGQTPLHGAAKFGDAAMLETLLARGAPVNAADKGGRTALHHAAERRDLAMVKTLLSYGANPDCKDRDGQTPITIATSRGSGEIVGLLTNRSARITIHSAASMGDLTALERLVEEGVDVNRLDVQGQTALHAAATAGRLEVVRWLVEHGAWLDLTDDNEATAFSIACRHAYRIDDDLSDETNAASLDHKYKAVMEYLISRGAKPGFSYGLPQEKVQFYSKEVADLLIEIGPDMDLSHDSQATLLHRAAWWGRKRVVEDLIKLGADLNATDRVGGTPLHAATQEGCTGYWDVIGRPHTDVMKLLLERGAKVDVANKDGRTALHGAVDRTDVNAVSLLIERGANVNAADAENRTPLDLATGRSRQKIADLLISKGAKTVVERSGGATGRHDDRGSAPVSPGAGIGVRHPVPWNTPLHQAVEKGDIEAVKSLLAQGADINMKAWNSETPLGVAVYRRQKEIVALLLARGSDVNSAYTGNGLAGTIPLHLALRSHQTEIAEMLITAGSDVNAQGGHERVAPLHLAVDNRALLELMLQHGGRIDIPSRDGKTCLHRAAVGGDGELARYLLDKGASVNLQDNKGNTALHWAAKGGHGEVCRVLLDHKADINIRNNKGLLALQYAEASDLKDIIVDLTPKTR